MKKLLSAILFGMILSSTSFARVEYVTEEVCPIPAGCRIVMETGECIGCVIKTRKIVIEDEEIVKTIEPKRSFRSPKKESNKKWTCIVGPCDWIDENGNLKS
tara:strand:- start:432 stop:737 length:306 start_codon:yes stop_codon:yes gene_type:complete